MKLFLAPIQGMTTACYRNAYARIFGGIDAYYSPFIATSEMKKVSTVLLKDLFPERNDPNIQVVPQLLSNNGTDFNAFATAIQEMGYQEINWNIGCPFPTVTTKKKGSGILAHPDMIKKFLDVVCKDISYKLTVKMRLGLDDLDDGIRVMKVLNEYTLGGVMIHARTGVQMYTGMVDLDAFEELATLCKHELTYNGDIFTKEDFQRICTRFPSIKNFMLGRGALQDPFLSSTIKGDSVPHEKKIGMLKTFHDEIFEYYQDSLSGDKHICDKMKEFWTYLSVHTDKDGKFMKKIKKVNTVKDYLEIANKVLLSPKAWSDIPVLEK